MKYEDLIKNLCGMILKFTPLTLIHLLMNKSLLYFMQIFIYTKCKTYFSSMKIIVYYNNDPSPWFSTKGVDQ